MKNLIKYSRWSAIALSALLFVILSGCSKEDSGDLLKSMNGITMKVNGEEWKCNFASVVSDGDPSDYSQGEYIVVAVVGNRIVGANAQDNTFEKTESIVISLAVPVSKFKNPKGSYPVIYQGEDYSHKCRIDFAASHAEGQMALYTVAEEGVSGTVEITDYEYGRQVVFGEDLGEGYLRLAGTFKATLPLDGSTNGTPFGQSVQLTEGKFNIKFGVSLGGF